MEIKVKEVSGVEEKSSQQREQEVIEKHTGDPKVDPKADPKVDPKEDIVIKDEDVLTYLRDKYQVEAESLSSILEKKELPEDVSKFLQYKEETGRGLDDFMKIQRDYDKVPEDQLLKAFMMETEKGLDEDDITYELGKMYSYDEEDDDDADIREKKIAKKKKIAEAKEYFNNLKDKYKAPLESKGVKSPGEGDKGYEEYQQSKAQQEEQRKEASKRYESFLDGTKKIFNEEFEGFEFKIGDNAVKFKSGDAKTLIDTQSDLNKFVSKFADPKTGAIVDHVGYHKAINAALNADRLAEFFYEKGVSDAGKNLVGKMNNSRGQARTAIESTSKGGVKVKATSAPSSKGLKMR